MKRTPKTASRITMTGPCTVTGNVTCPGGSSAISLPAGSTVGSVQASTVDLPDIHTADFDAGKFGATQIVPDTTLTPAPNSSLTGSNYYRPEGQPGTLGTLTVNGSLTLSNALLYVDGNLVVNGGLNGCGIVAVTGTTTVTGGVDVVSENNLIALVGDGDITLSGSLTGTVKPYFQGLVYTRGNFNAANITIAGEFILAPPEGTTVPTDGSPLTASGKMVLSNVSVTGINGLKFTVKPPPLPAMPASIGNTVSTTAPNGDSNGITQGIAKFDSTGTRDLSHFPPGIGPANLPVRIEEPLVGHYDPAIGQTMVLSESQVENLYAEQGPPPAPFAGMQLYYDAAADRYDSSLATLQNSIYFRFAEVRHGSQYDGGAQATVSELTYDDAMQRVKSDPEFQYALTASPSWDSYAQTYYLPVLQADIRAYDTQYQSSKPAVPIYQKVGPELNLNTFFGNVTPIHVLSWKDLP